MKRYWMGISIIALTMVNGGFVQKGPNVPSANEIMTNLAKGFDEVKDFIVTIDAEVKMERAQIPKMSATMYFKKPDKIHFNSQNFLIVPREGIALNPAMLQERYSASLGGIDTIEGKTLCKLLLAAKDETVRLRQLYLWVDLSNWTVAKIETAPYEGRTLSLVFSYELQQEKYWLPSKLVASFGVLTESEKTTKESMPAQAQQFEELQRAMPRTGNVTILYSNYKVNVGLDDSIFKKEK